MGDFGDTLYLERDNVKIGNAAILPRVLHRKSMILSCYSTRRRRESPQQILGHKHLRVLCSSRRSYRRSARTASDRARSPSINISRLALISAKNFSRLLAETAGNSREMSSIFRGLRQKRYTSRERPRNRCKSGAPAGRSCRMIRKVRPSSYERGCGWSLPLCRWYFRHALIFS